MIKKYIKKKENRWLIMAYREDKTTTSIVLLHIIEQNHQKK